MASEITFLGSGGGRDTMASQARGTGGIIFNLNNSQIHLDPGPGSAVYAKMFNVDLSKTSLILVSHEHIDNSNDLNLLIDIISQGGNLNEKKGHLITTSSVVENVLSDFHKPFLEKISVVSSESDHIIVDGIQIFFTKTKNHDDAVGFILKTAKFCIGYISESAFFNSLPNQYLDCNVLIINNTSPFSIPCKSHLSSEDTVKILSKVNPKLAIIQHFGSKMLESNPIYEAREIKKQTGVQVIAASDGMSIDLVSYSVTGEQKNLADF